METKRRRMIRGEQILASLFGFILTRPEMWKNPLQYLQPRWWLKDRSNHIETLNKKFGYKFEKNEIPFKKG